MAKPVGPYSPFVRSGDFVITSGQIGIDDDGKLADGLDSQVKQALSNLASVLADAGTSANNVVKTTLFVTDMTKYGRVNELYSEMFGDIKPARSTVCVAALPLGAEFEIDAWASI